MSNVLYWSTKDSTRVVVDIDDEVKYEKAVLSNPHRMYLDLIHTRLSSELLGKSFLVEDKLLYRIRLGQHKSDMVRVVFDFEEANDCNVLTLQDPFRIVIDLTNSRRKAKQEPERSLEEKKISRKERERPNTPAEAVKESVVGDKPSLEASKQLIRTLGLKIGKIVIDPGHGGWDSGTVSRHGLKEKDLVLDVAKKLGRSLERKVGTQVVFTRESDTFIPLEERIAFANDQAADLFISIHANASKNKHASGVETYFLSLVPSEESKETAARENSTAQKTIHELEDLIKRIALREKIDESKEFASTVQRSLFNSTKKFMPKAKNRGVKHAPFVVLIGARMPSILIEIAFLSNPNDERLLKQTSSREKIAESVCQGIEAYMKALGDNNLALKGTQ